MVVIGMVTKKVEGVSADGSETKALSHDAWRQWPGPALLKCPDTPFTQISLCRSSAAYDVIRPSSVQSHVVAPKPGFLDAVGEPIHGKGVAR